MVFLAVLIIFGFFGAAMLFSTSNNFGGPEFGSFGMSSVASTFFAVYIVIAAVIWFFPLLYTLRFANQMKIALAGNDQQALNKSFQNLKICLRFLGIITIIILAIYAIVIVFAIVGASMFS
jgi:flagellar biosynthesis protein FlhB